MSFPTFAKLMAAIWQDSVATDKADIRAYGLTLEAHLNALTSNPVLINGQLSVTVAANVLTVAVKTLAGNDPSAADPVYAVFRSATAGSGAQSVIAITAATSLTVSAGSTLGGADGIPLRAYVLGFNDAGTFRLGIVNLWSGGVRYPLPRHGIASSTAEGGAGAADSAGVIYTGTAVTSKAFRILGALTWVTALTTAGLYAAAPDYVKPWGPDDLLPNAHPSGFLWGLTLSNNGSDAANDIDIATGSALADGDLGVMTLTSSITKRSDAAWAVGTGNGGMDTGSKANSSWGYVWLIGRSDTGVIDALFSASATAPTMPAGYDQKRRIGAVRFGASTAPILAFKQFEDNFIWDVIVNDLALTNNPGTSAVNRTLTAPPNMTVIIDFYFSPLSNMSNTVLVTETAQTDTAPTTSLFSLRCLTGNTVATAMSELRRKVDASSQVRVRMATSGAADGYEINTVGYVDTRGRLS